MSDNHHITTWARRNAPRYATPLQFLLAAHRHAQTTRLPATQRLRIVHHAVNQTAHAPITWQQTRHAADIMTRRRYGADYPAGTHTPAGGTNGVGGNSSSGGVAVGGQTVLYYLSLLIAPPKPASPGSALSAARLAWVRRLVAHVVVREAETDEAVILSQRFTAALLGCSVPKARQVLADAVASGLMRESTTLRDRQTRTFRLNRRRGGYLIPAAAAVFRPVAEALVRVGPERDPVVSRLVDLVRHSTHPGWAALPPSAWVLLYSDAARELIAPHKTAVRRALATARRRVERGWDETAAGVAAVERAWSWVKRLETAFKPRVFGGAGRPAVLRRELETVGLIDCRVSLVAVLDRLAAAGGHDTAQVEAFASLRAESRERRARAAEIKNAGRSTSQRPLTPLRSASERAELLITRASGTPPTDRASALEWLTRLGAELNRSGALTRVLADRHLTAAVRAAIVDTLDGVGVAAGRANAAAARMLSLG